MPSPVLLISLPPADRPAGRPPLVMVVEQLLPPPVAGGSFGGPDDVGEQHRGQQPLGPWQPLAPGVDHDIADAWREVDVVAVGCLSKSDVFQEASPSTALENWSSKVTLLHPGSRRLWPRCE